MTVNRLEQMKTIDSLSHEVTEDNLPGSLDVTENVDNIYVSY